MSRARPGGPSSSGRPSARAAVATAARCPCGRDRVISKLSPATSSDLSANAARSAANAGSGNAETFARVSCRILRSSLGYKAGRVATHSCCSEGRSGVRRLPLRPALDARLRGRPAAVGSAVHLGARERRVGLRPRRRHHRFGGRPASRRLRMLGVRSLRSVSTRGGHPLREPRRRSSARRRWRTGGRRRLGRVPPRARPAPPRPAAGGLGPVLAAPLTDAGLTPYHAVRRSWPKLAPGTSAVVIGVGGLGHLGVQILEATTAATVIAVDTRAEALALAEECGADVTVAAADDAATRVRDATGGRRADVVVDFVGVDSTLALGAAVARPLGDLTIVGIGGGTLPVSFFSVPYELSIQTTYWGSWPELEEVLILGASGRLRPRITTFPLTEAMDAYRQIQAGKLEGRAVIAPTPAG